jgi:GT2 family glycosyltransferase
MHVTVCICTRDRCESIVRTLHGVTNSLYPDFDVVIVDQSTDDSTAQAVEQIATGDQRFTYIRSQSTGASRARNVCVEHARGPLVAFTDDDCEVTERWLELLVACFREHDDVGEICGAVLPGPHDSSLGFIPDYPIISRRQISTPWLKWREGGIGANMAFRLDVLRAVGPFDEVLGPGSLLFNCEDGDMTYRVLKAGYGVLELPDACVIHHGFRTWEEGQIMMRRVGIAVASAYMKHLRLLDLAVLPTLLYEWGRCISWKRLLRLRRHSGISRFLGYTLGLVISFRYGIDSHWRIYKVEKSQSDDQIYDHKYDTPKAHDALAD